MIRGLVVVTGDDDTVHLDNQGISGPPGPRGPAGSDGRNGSDGTPGGSFIHSQQMPQAVWEISHGMGYMPAVTVMDTQGTVIEGDVELIDMNTIRITFFYPFAGSAYFS